MNSQIYRQIVESAIGAQKAYAEFAEELLMNQEKNSFVIGLYRIPTEKLIIASVLDCMDRNKITIKKLSELSGVSDSTIRRWLSKKTTIKYSTMEKIVSALDILDRDFWRFYGQRK